MSMCLVSTDDRRDLEPFIAQAERDGHAWQITASCARGAFGQAWEWEYELHVDCPHQGPAAA